MSAIDEIIEKHAERAEKAEALASQRLGELVRERANLTLLKDALRQAAVDLGNASALLRLEGLMKEADVILKAEAGARAVLKRASGHRCACMLCGLRSP
jgi:hypothetical protein